MLRGEELYCRPNHSFPYCYVTVRMDASAVLASALPCVSSTASSPLRSSDGVSYVNPYSSFSTKRLPLT